MMRHGHAPMAALLVAVAVVVAIKLTMVNISAQVDDAVSVSPTDFDFGVAIMEASYDAACNVATDPTGASGNCMSIHLSNSFLSQTEFVDVEYSVSCEDKAPGDPHRADANITPFSILRDSDPADANDALDEPNGPGNGCGQVEYAPGTPNSVHWARGELDKRFDSADLWDMLLVAPLCANNFSPETDPLQPAGQPGGGLIDPKFCHKGPGGGPGNQDSDEYTDLASNVRFQVTSFSTATPTPTPTPTPTATPSPTPTGTALPFTSTPKPTASPSPTPSAAVLAFTATPRAFPATGGSSPSNSAGGLWIVLAGTSVLALALVVYASRKRRVCSD